MINSRLLAMAGMALSQLFLCTLAVAQPEVSRVDSVSISVSDLQRSVEFYRDVLGFREVAEREQSGNDMEHMFGVFGMRVRVERMQLGEEFIELTQFLAPRGRPMPADTRANDGWFQHVAIIVSDIEKGYSRLRSFKVEQASTGPQRLPDWNPNAGGIKAYYFRDPDGNFLELLEFPPGKGNQKWARRDGTLFLGIDHTAIVVADTEASLHYYRDLLGMKVVGRSENYGTEQEHLNNVFGARLRITTLHAAAGPGVELLEYLAPRSGRAYPADTLPNDHWYWQTNLRTADLGALAGAALDAHVSSYAGGVTRLSDASPGYQAGLVLRDPDGHACLLAEESSASREGRDRSH
jgi:catechol 2,3-dioxygenase-like lactoylglutathione lyase family enzyme